jgi:sugar phosphate isomerase/epimerase
MAPGVEIWRYCSEPEELARLVEAIGMPIVGICMDIGHAHLMHADWDEYLSIYGKHLITLHVADNDRAIDQHFVPGRGSVDWEKLMPALKQ